MTPFDRDPGLVLADAWQHDFPLCAAPFEKAGASHDLSETETLAIFERLQKRGLMSRIGPVVRPNSAGASTLAAMAVPPSDLDTVAATVSAEPFVNHNYAREHAINLWFVVAAPDAAALAATLARIEATCGLPVLDLRLVEPFHIDLGFGLTGRRAPTPARRTSKRPASSREKRLLAALEDGLPLMARPYAEIARRLAWGEAEVIETLAGLREAGIVSRFGCVLHHRRLGFTANAMAVWDVDDARVSDTGKRMAGQTGVTLCYRRNRVLPHWPYNLFAMVHGRDESAVRADVARIAAAAGTAGLPHEILFSRRCFVQRGARFSMADAAGRAA